MSNITTSNNTRRFERFESLSSGEYWISTCDIPTYAISEGTTLLIESIKWIDGKPHTIIVRAHPGQFNQPQTITEKDPNGQLVKRTIAHTTYPFLLNDFIKSFAFNPDGASIRASELAEAQGRIAQLQKELIETQSNPDKLQYAIAAMDCADDQTDLPAISSNTLTASESGLKTLSDALAGGITEDNINTFKSVAKSEYEKAALVAKWITSKTNEISDQLSKMSPFFSEQSAAALAKAEDTKVLVSDLSNSIESLNLYIGKDVTLTHLATGKNANKSEPLTLCQRKLFADEELCVWVDQEDFRPRNPEIFANMLKEEPRFMSQVFPTERCVVAMSLSRQAEYDNADFRKVFLLIRNGDNVTRVDSPISTHQSCEVLFPSKNDQDNIFTGIDGSDITFEDLRYTGAVKAHKKHALHYKRLLILLAGLDNNHQIFGDFHDNQSPLDFVSLRFQEQHCRFIHDHDGSGLLAGEERTPLNQWIFEKNSKVQSGSRIICNYHDFITPKTAPSLYIKDRDFPVKWPVRDFEILVAAQRGESLTIKVATIQQHNKIKNSTLFIPAQERLTQNAAFGFLCLDYVTLDEVQWYINDRKTRPGYLKYIHLLKKAKKHLEQELEQESDIRDMLHKSLIDAQICDKRRATSLANQAIQVWRASKRGKPLPAMSDMTKNARNALLNTMYIIEKFNDSAIVAIERFCKNKDIQPLRVSIHGTSNIVLYTTRNPDLIDNRFMDYEWVDRNIITYTNKGISIRRASVVHMPRFALAETSLHEWPEVNTWYNKPRAFNNHLSKARILDSIDHAESRIKSFIGAHENGELEMHTSDFKNEVMAIKEYLGSEKEPYLPELTIPVGLIRHYGSIKIIALTNRYPMITLQKLGTSERSEALIRNSYMDFTDVQSAMSQGVSKLQPWVLKLCDFNEDIDDFNDNYALVPNESSRLSEFHYTISDQLNKIKKQANAAKNTIYFSGQSAEISGIDIDKILDISEPEDINPCLIYRNEVTIRIDGKPVRKENIFTIITDTNYRVNPLSDFQRIDLLNEDELNKNASISISTKRILENFHTIAEAIDYLSSGFLSGSGTRLSKPIPITTDDKHECLVIKQI